MMDFLLPLLILLVTALSAYLVSRKTLSLLRKRDSKYAILFSVLAFLFTSCLILFVIGFVIISNMEFGR